MAKITPGSQQRFVESTCWMVTGFDATAIPDQKRGDSEYTGRQQHGHRVKQMRRLKL
jgi:hypothetical protein